MLSILRCLSKDFCLCNSNSKCLIFFFYFLFPGCLYTILLNDKALMEQRKIYVYVSVTDESQDLVSKILDP